MITTQPISMDREDLKSISPAQVETYMEQKEWVRVEVDNRWGQYWEPTTEGSVCHREILENPHTLPFSSGRADFVMSLTSQHLGDYDNRMIELMITLGVFEGRLASDVLADIKAINHDEYYPAWVASMKQRGLTVEDK